jgi:hypothetical protein
MNAFMRNRSFVTLTILVGLVGIKGISPLSQKEKIELEMALFWSDKRYGKQKYNVLLMGDSRTYMDVSPKILREYVPNVSIYNFAFSGGRINGQLLQEALRRLKENGKRVLVFSCTSCSLMSVRNKHFFSIKESPMVPFLLPSSFIPTKNYNERRVSTSPGFGYLDQNVNRNEDFALRSYESYRREFLSRPFRPSDFEHFVQNLKWCERNNIKVVAYRIVSCREMDELEDKLSGVDWNKIKQAVLDEGFIWLERPPSPLLEQIEEHCYDGSHLNTGGSQMFSHWLGKELSKLEWFKENRQTSETKE